MPPVSVSSSGTKAPLRGRRVFLDTNSSAVQLRRQLESLGARVETFFSKDIWCVITDKQIREHDHRGSLGLLCGTISQPVSPIESSVNKRSPFLNRTQALLQAAQRREVRETSSRGASNSLSKTKDDVQSVVQECRQWDIPLLSMKSAQRSVGRLYKKYQLDSAQASTSGKKVSSSAVLRKTVSDSHIGKSTRLDDGAEFIKLEDTKQLHKPLYKTFTGQQLQSWPQLRVSAPLSGLGATLCPFTPAEEYERYARKRKAVVGEDFGAEKKSRQDNQAQKEHLQEPSKSHNKIDPAHAGTAGHLCKRKSVSRTADTKQRYCELCQEFFVSLRMHLESSSHQRRSTSAVIELERMANEFQADIFQGSTPLLSLLEDGQTVTNMAVRDEPISPDGDHTTAPAVISTKPRRPSSERMIPSVEV